MADLGGFFFDVEKFFGSTACQRMSFSEKGVYLVMLFQQWRERGRNLPDDVRAVAELIAVTQAQVEEVLAAWDTVRRKFVTSKHSPDRIYNVVVERTRRTQRKNRRARQDAGREGGKAKAAKRRMAEALEASNARALLESATAKPSVKEIDQIRSDQKREEEKKKEPLSVAEGNPSRDPFVEPTTTSRAGAFVRLFKQLFAEHQAGAKYLGNERRDYDAAVELCAVWDDARLEKLAICFLTTDHKFAADNSRTIPRLKALASWLDGELAKWEKARAS